MKLLEKISSISKKAAFNLLFTLLYIEHVISYVDQIAIEGDMKRPVMS